MYSQPVDDGRATFERAGEIYRYTVRPGDSLYDIGRRFNTSYEMIAGLNGIDKEAILQIGQELLIPVLFNQPKPTMRSYVSYPAMYF